MSRVDSDCSASTTTPNTQPASKSGLDESHHHHQKSPQCEKYFFPRGGNSISCFPLLALPLDIQRRILENVDVYTLAKLSQCNRHLNRESLEESLWRRLAMQRFRVTLRTPASRRLQAAGHVRWRTLYLNWHTQGRIPVSRYSGPNLRAFAKGRASGVFVWFTVTSTEDCRLVDDNLRFRIIVQNVSCKQVRVCTTEIAFRINNIGTIGFLNPPHNGCSASILNTAIDRAPENHCAHENLLCNDVTVVFGTVHIPGCAWEVDVLERISDIITPVIADGKRYEIVSHLADRFWDSYELFPGGWWARVG